MRKSASMRYRVNCENLRVTTYASLVFVTFGCSRSDGKPVIVPAKGIVMREGKPLPDAVVQFKAEKSSVISMGKTDSGGRFVLTTYISGDGAVVGENAIAVIKAGPPLTDREIDEQASHLTGITDPAEQVRAAQQIKTDRMRRAAANTKTSKKRMLIPSKYADLASSGLKQVVEKGKANDFQIILPD